MFNQEETDTRDMKIKATLRLKPFKLEWWVKVGIKKTDMYKFRALTELPILLLEKLFLQYLHDGHFPYSSLTSNAISSNKFSWPFYLWLSIPHTSLSITFYFPCSTYLYQNLFIYLFSVFPVWNVNSMSLGSSFTLFTPAAPMLTTIDLCIVSIQ